MKSCLPMDESKQSKSLPFCCNKKRNKCFFWGGDGDGGLGSNVDQDQIAQNVQPDLKSLLSCVWRYFRAERITVTISARKFNVLSSLRVKCSFTFS